MAVPTKFVPVLRLPRNDRGRDFIVSDVHGMFDLLLRALDEVKFDPARDRILGGGDWVDRGHGSAQCLDLLNETCVHSARGNHEQMALESFSPGGELLVPERDLDTFMHNGLGWWLAHTPESRVEMLALLARLPLALELETPRGLVGVVHADVPAGKSWQQFTKALEALDHKTVQTALWGRKRLQGGDKRGVPGVGRVFVGHTPQWGGLKRYGNVYAMDTGAVFGDPAGGHPGQLTLANILTRTATMTPPAGPQNSVLTVINEADTPAYSFGMGKGYIDSDVWNWSHLWTASPSLGR